MARGEELRRCGRCGQRKPIADFAWRRKAKGQRHNYCRPCHSDYHREHYLANKERYVAQAAAQKKRLRMERTRYLLTYFAENPCADCGETDPLVLEFDHLGDKEFEVSQGLDFRGWQTILDEIEKCDVVCANCHRRRTARRRKSLRYLLTKEDKAAIK
jgi:hypothetical protein